ncbi:type II CRISPR RNA-guided endonuclease Cas9 [Aquibium microcysteis]|uniref:type II CRISPR RNA-guided endonuclease Cas9 n=1 Tax=Aquibium microcysteis TaxID=675281 RepID=UPI00165CFD9B|nr:type II CRISPR RNA-guided endonuclease Cas9 [Aquibium microcysteis]
MRKKLFSFDMGTNSIGWCVFNLGPSNEPIAIVDAGVRIFSDGREPKSGNSLAEGRRMVRGMARRRDRYKRRRKAVLRTLTEYGLMPSDPGARAALVAETNDARRDRPANDVYALRARGLDERLPLHHLGRALFHLQQRRGFKSNRKADRRSNDNEKGAIAIGEDRLRTAMHEAGARTLGEFLAGRRGTDPLGRGGVRVRIDAAASSEGEGRREKPGYDFYPVRAMLEDEFDQIWARQAEFWPEVLTDDRRRHLFRVMFYQRPLKPPVVGKCSFNPSEMRLAKAHPLFQTFRLYKEVNELELVMPDQSQRKLTKDERDALVIHLRGVRSAGFPALRKTLKLSERGTRFNKEHEGREKLLGDEIHAAMSDKALFGNRWAAMPMDRQWETVERLREENDPLALHRWLVEQAGLSDEAAEKAADAKLPEGYGRLGRTALATMLEELKADVITEAEAARRAGYDHALARHGEAVERLPKYQEILERRIPPGTGDLDDEYDIQKGRITNPTVHIALNQLQVVTNRLIARHGRPERIHIELARELNQSEDQKREATARNARNRRDAERRSAILTEFGQPDNGFNRQLLKQWEELNPGDPLDRRCIYSGTVITPTMLFSGAVDIDHILPWSRTLDDGATNRILCTREANREKRNFAPAEVPAWGDHYDDILERAQRLPPNKRWRFALDAMERFEKDRDFLDRQLTDTQYLARLAHDYLGALFPDEEADGDGVVKKRNHVVVVTGRMTEMLRRKWGLNGILPDHNFADPTKTKNRKDHRHHAIDAAVIGVTSRSLLKRVADAARDGETQGAEDAIRTLSPPWLSFRDDLKVVVDRIVVSHKPDHGTLPKPGETGRSAGQLHNDTAYGLTGEVDARGNPIVVRRKPFLSLQPKDLHAVRDLRLRAALENATHGFGGRDFTAALIKFRQAAGHHYRGIRRVRVVEGLSVISIRDKDGRAYKGYKGDANFRYDVWELPDGRWIADVITMFDAHRPDIDWQKRRPHPAARKVLSLKQNDMVAYDDPRGGPTIGIVVKFGQNGQITLVAHKEAGELKNRDALPNSAEEALARGAEPDQDGRVAFDPFKYYSPTAGGLRKIGLRQVRVDEAGRIFDPGPRDKNKKSPRNEPR